MDSRTATIAGAIIVGAALIAGAIFFSRAPADPEGRKFNPDAMRAPNATDHRLGPTDSPVKLVVYTDLECPFCKQFHTTLLELSAKYPKLAIIYRNFPLSIHPKAETEARAAECAAKMGGEEAYWKMVNRIFKVTPSNNGLDLTQLPEIAKEAGITDTARFQTCLDSNETKERVQLDLKEANETGGEGTPWTIFLTPAGNKIPVNGARSLEVMSAAIEEAFKEIQ